MTTRRGLLVVLVCAAAGCSATRGEIAVSVYGGKSFNSNSDLRLKQPGGTDLDFLGVELLDKSFESPPFYGVRGTYWFPETLGTVGLALDFTHPKAISDTTQVVRQSGTKAGAPVNGALPISDNLEGFELSHGHNLLTLNVMRRWFLKGERDTTFLGRLQPYVGGGAGVAIPHVDVTVDGVSTSEYQLGGPTIQALAGLNFDIAGPVSAFTEYKINWAHVTSDLNGGGSIRSEFWTHQFILGLTVRF